MDDDTVIECTRISERERVECWRLAELLRAGYALTVAEELALRSDVDLHQALKLVEHGCAPDVAAQILL